MKELNLEIEELEERIAPAAFAVTPHAPSSATPVVPNPIDGGAAANAQATHSGGVVNIGP